ncbi:MAG: hypothetical protein WDM79_13495 [Terricaulis sp.]
MSNLKKLDDKVRVKPGDKAGLASRDTAGEGIFADKDEAKESLADDAKAIDVLQDRLWADAHAALCLWCCRAPIRPARTARCVACSIIAGRSG